MGKSLAMYERSRVPLYAQVASVMRHRIETGHWREGDRISTLEKLEEEFSVGRVTVRQAIELLRVEGLLDVRQGRGTFVSGRPKNERWLNLAIDFDTLVASIKENVIKNVSIDRDVDPPVVEEGEGTVAGKYAFIRSVQYNEGAPFSVVDLYLSKEIFDREPDYFSRAPALPRIVELEDVKVAHAFQTLTIGVAGPEAADLLCVGLGEPTLDCRLVLLDDDGIVIYYASIHYHKNCFSLRVDLLEKIRWHEAQESPCFYSEPKASVKAG